MNRYSPPSPKSWNGRPNELQRQRIHQTVELINLADERLSIVTPGPGLLGFCCDTGIKRNYGRPGAVSGPSAIRRALGRLPVPHIDSPLYDAGDIACLNEDLEAAQLSLARTTAMLLHHGILPIILGGGHEMAWGVYQGHKQHGSHRELTLINFDAHYDLRPLDEGKFGNSGTSFLQIATDRFAEALPFHYACIGIQPPPPFLAQTAKELKVATITAAEIHLKGMEFAIPAINKIIADSGSIHLSICMDVFASAFAPGVSAPQPLGLMPWQVIPVIHSIASSGKLSSVEIAEVSPPLDTQDLTSRLAASLIDIILSKNDSNLIK